MAFTIEFDDNGLITRVFSGGLTSAEGVEVTPEVYPTNTRTEQPKGVIARAVANRLSGKAVKNITSVSILTTEDHDPCISQAGKDWCW